MELKGEGCVKKDARNITAVALLSGGLDSQLAVKLIQRQAVTVDALHFVSAFAGRCGEGPCRLVKMVDTAERLGVPIHFIDSDAALFDAVRRPVHGLGKNMNPCIDCRILRLKMAADFMRRVGARFLVTGEVLGQRPMSQRLYSLRLIEQEAGLRGLIVRPLSARLLPPTIPEREGWIDREQLAAISGRSRKTQNALAKELGIVDYPAPAGGCLLTNPQFSHRLAEALENSADVDLSEVHLLKHGRHFRLAPGTRAIVGRNEADNKRIEALARPGDLRILLADLLGPLGLLCGEHSEENIRTAAALVAHYSKAATQPTARLHVSAVGSRTVRTIEVVPATQALANSLMIVKND